MIEKRITVFLVTNRRIFIVLFQEYFLKFDLFWYILLYCNSLIYNMHVPSIKQFKRCGNWGTVNTVNHTCWMTIVTPKTQSLCNQRFWWRFVWLLCFVCIFCLYWGFCQRTEFDLFISPLVKKWKKNVVCCPVLYSTKLLACLLLCTAYTKWKSKAIWNPVLVHVLLSVNLVQCIMVSDLIEVIYAGNDEEGCGGKKKERTKKKEKKRWNEQEYNISN